MRPGSSRCVYLPETSLFTLCVQCADAVSLCSFMPPGVASANNWILFGIRLDQNLGVMGLQFRLGNQMLRSAQVGTIKKYRHNTCSASHWWWKYELMMNLFFFRFGQRVQSQQLSCYLHVSPDCDMIVHQLIRSLCWNFSSFNDSKLLIFLLVPGRQKSVQV